MPLAFLSRILLLRRAAWGYLLASIFVLKVVTLGLYVPDSLAIVIPFLVITLLNLAATVALLRNIRA